MNALTRLLVPVAAATLALACADAPPSGPATLAVHAAALAPCDGAGNDDGRWPAGADKVVVRVTGGAIPAGEPLVRVFPSDGSATDATAQVDDVPEGAGMTLEVVACTGASATWEGVHADLDVVAGQDTPVTLFLTPVGQVACVGMGSAGTDAPASAAHAFAATAADADAGWLLGGFTSFQLLAGWGSMAATSRVDRYDRETSTWTAAGQLAEARAMALAQPVGDGRIRLVGGTTDVELWSSGLPVRTTASSAPADGIELWDPSTGATSGGAGIRLPALPAVVALSDGRALAVGGIDAGDVPAARAWLVDGATPTEVSLPDGRYGAAVAATDGGALVWGGRPDAVSGVGLWIDTAAGTATALTGADGAPMTLFASVAWLGSGAGGVQRFLVLGGTEVQGTDAAPKPAAKVAAANGLVVTVDPAAGTVTTEAAGLGADEPLFRRAAASLIDLGGGEHWLVGGFTVFGPDAAVCPGQGTCFQEVAPRLAPSGTSVGVLEPRLELSVGTFGATPVRLSDGTWLLGGGLPAVEFGAKVDAHAALVRHRAERSALCAFEVPATP